MDEGKRQVLEKLGIKVGEPSKGIKYAGRKMGAGLVTFEITESHPSWPYLKSLIVQWDAVDIVWTEFSDSELKKAHYLRMQPGWHHGYPQPEDDFGYLNLSYDLTSYCSSCGIGAHQINPFRMKGEPRWGKRHILQLNWIYDEFFVLPQVWERVFRPFGISYIPVLHHRTGKKLNTVVQLDIKLIASSKLQLANHPYEICKVCKRKKYLPFVKGKFPSFTGALPDAHAVKTQEYFGSGAEAFREIVISSALFHEITAHKIKGAKFEPLEE